MRLPDLKDDFYRKLSSLVFPIAIQSFMLALVSATDALMLGLVDQTSLSSVSLAAQVQFVLSLYVMGITGGMGILCAQYWGKKDPATLEKVGPIAMRLNLPVGALFTLMALFIPEALMKLLTNDPALVAAGASYLRPVALSYVLFSVSQGYLTMLKNTGATKVASRISSTAVVVNIILNTLLIFGLLGFPKMGIRGAAVATTIARAIELIWSVWESGRKDRIPVRWSKLFRREKVLSQDFFKYTWPVLFASLVWGIAYTLYSVIMGHLGSDAVAANSITSISKSLVSCLIRGVSAGAGIMIGNVLGAGELEKAKRWGSRLSHMAIAVGIGTGLLLMALSPLIVRVTTMSDTAKEYLQIMLIFCGFNIMGQSANTTVLDGIFCAGGDSKFDAIGNLFAMWCFSVPVGFFAAFVLKLPPMWVYLILNLDEIVKLPAVYKRYKKYIWVRNITR